MNIQEWLWAAAGAAALATVAAGLADWRRNRRRELDDPGWVPWRGIQVLALFAAMGFVVLAVMG